MLLRQANRLKSKSLSSLQRSSHRLWRERRIWLTAIAVTGGVLGLRWLGGLQFLELAALDRAFRLRPADPVDERIVIVGINDIDIQNLRDWPISDRVMADLLQKIKSYQPRAIGLDIYREFSVGEGGDELKAVFRTTPNLIGIEKIPDSTSPGVEPPKLLKQAGQVGFNNVLTDSDNRVRRVILYWGVNGELRRSFALKLALLYLQDWGISTQPAPDNPAEVKLGQSVLRRLGRNDGGYVRADDGGYQILANTRSSGYRTVSLTEVLNGEVDPALMRDRIVLIGSTAESLNDFFFNSYSREMNGTVQRIPGVALHANFISQLLDAALYGRSPLQVWISPVEWIWILGWSLVGAVVSWRFRHPAKLAISLLGSSSLLLGSCYLAFFQGWWIPLVPPLLALVGSSGVITSYIAYLKEELKKSKEFLSSVIHMIPDPVFVKDRQGRWIVLNEAFCRFVGYPLETLLDKTDHDIFPPHQANFLRQHDESVFETGLDSESEEEFTSADGAHYLTATKRSLHKDAAGNTFLVGVIRDITQRKQMEEELRRTAAELVRSNAELKQAQYHLQHLAYHDSLTGLPNRQLLCDRLLQSLLWAQEHDQLVAVLFLDLDGFKHINDTYGHAMGNLLLKAVAQRLSRCLRNSDTVARFGGDEFVVLLPAIPHVQDVTRVAEKILDTLSQSFALEGESIPVTTSIGISLYPTHGDDPETLLKQADLAMYQAKQAGKRQYALPVEVEKRAS
ncbi:CHASE2 domain-containing protein [Thermoleptolyngbya sichuanensis XZ-Cy5]|uniref:CHASE2 domain-containing protein n=1 Tax=Thermoleptolyngbya sichuanensis TaxID=2885951 RepID=UPI00240D5535|nr:CHASE2 domain-containing protein [Thermoleptolyngbya sichuanensis]MDG2615236.1 CHASE2 domain-containing protein [Thermoleptolyngbya sichuanensis XZ-Cy5]